MSWVLTAKVGDKVVCLKGFSTDLVSGERSPVAGQVYTIRTMEVGDDGDVYLRFGELINPVMDYRQGMCEAQFWAAKFRPVQSRPTDISFAHDILKSVSETVGEDA